MMFTHYMRDIAILLCFAIISFNASADELLKQLNNLHYKIDGPRTDTKTLEQEHLALLENYKSPQDQARIYAALTDMYHQSGLIDPDSAAKYAELSLALNQSPAQQVRLYVQWGDALQAQNRGVTGNELAEARRKVVVPYLKGLKITIDHKVPENPATFPVHIRKIYSGPTDTEEYRNYVEEMNQVAAEVENIRMINALVMERDVSKNQIVDIYSKRPYATEELRRIALEILGDPAVADELTESVKKAIGIHIKRDFEKDVKEITNNITLEPHPAGVAAVIDAPTAIPTAIPNTLDEEKPEIKDIGGNKSYLLYIIMVITLTGLALLTYYMMRRR